MNITVIHINRIVLTLVQQLLIYIIIVPICIIVIKLKYNSCISSITVKIPI